jgi:xylose isomerase
MLSVIRQGGLGKGGLNFDCKVRRESIDVEDMFIAHIGAMDCFARALRIAAKIVEDKSLEAMVEVRYASFLSGMGKKIEDGTASFDELEAFIMENGDPNPKSAKQEKFEVIFNDYLFSA